MLEISKSLITPVVALLAVYIAWQQWRTNDAKLRLDQYDRRLRIYEEVRQILGLILRDAGTSYEELSKFYRAVSEADFLFGPEIPKYINEIHKHGVELTRWNKEYRDSTQPIPEGYDHKKVCDNMHEELIWLTSQFEPAKEKFRKYLSLHNESLIAKIRQNVLRFFRR